MDWLKKIRKEKNLKAKDVAQSLGISKSSYSQIETGRRRPNVDRAKQIGKFLEFNWTRFYEDEN